jgi:Raf kinase inhibitor-like YbhB/YbcL family protein
MADRVRVAVVRSLIAAALLLTSLLGGLAGCRSGNGTTASGPRQTRATIGLSSAAFINGSSIPSRYTCDGEDIAPPLIWTRVPARARSLALLVVDQNAPGGVFLHWSVYNLPRGSSGTGTGHLPQGSAEGRNSFGNIGYGGPCPPRGDPPHHYVFSIHALDDNPGLAPGASPVAVREAVAAHAIAAGALTGTYRR